MTKKVIQPEDEQFGVGDAWKLLSRGVVEDVRTTVRVLPIQGRGVLVQTARQEKDGDGWTKPIYDEPVLVDKVLVMEYVEAHPSQITDEQGNPTSVTVKCVGRELVDAAMVKRRFQPGGNKRNGKGGPYDHLMIIPGVVLTMEQRTAPSSFQATEPMSAPPAAEV